VSRRADRSPARRTPDGGDDGFSLVEVLVAMTVFAVVALASLGFLTTALSATALARTEAVAKNLNQERLESMRNLPFYRHANVSAVPDFLDTYYTTTANPAPSTSATGFVAASGARDTSLGDPATGAFYRRVFAPTPAFPGFYQRVTTQFLLQGTTVLANPIFVSTAADSTGLPPTPTVGVRVTTLWTAQGRQRRFTVESQITDAAVTEPLVTLQARLSTVRVTGILPEARELVAEAGVVNLDGSSASTTVASATAQGGVAVVAEGPRADGAVGTASAPPATSVTVAPVSARSLVDGTEVAAFSQTSVTGLSVSTSGGQTVAGTSAAPVTSVLHGSGLGGDYFRASNLPSTTSSLGLTGGPVIRGFSSGCGGSCEAVQGKGWLSSTGGATHAAGAFLEGAFDGTLAVLPTVQSPDGILQLTLTGLSVECTSVAGAVPPGSARVTYSGTLRYRTWSLADGYGYSTPIDIGTTNGSDPLAAIELTTTVVGVDASGTPLRLADYIRSWSSLTSAAAGASTVVATDGSAASVSIPGVFTLASQPLRPEPASTIGLQIGVSSCTAGDRR
jgi:prepilin-type N-terminal cleavage/methylation domain-containing protein